MGLRLGLGVQVQKIERLWDRVKALLWDGFRVRVRVRLRNKVKVEHWANGHGLF